jgi:hypothetical protein
MSFDCRHSARCISLPLGLLFAMSCANEERITNTIGVRVSPLELACATAPADVLGDFTAILASTEPLDPSQPQSYGSDECAGFIFEFDNPDLESLRGAWVQASGESVVNPAILGESLCPERTLEVDYWAFKDREWSKLAASSTTASFEPRELAGIGYCRLEGLIEQESAFEKLRIVARATDGVDTYPMYACLW